MPLLLFVFKDDIPQIFYFNDKEICKRKRSINL